MRNGWSVMIDTETLGMNDKGLIVTLGACWFSKFEIGPMFYERIDPVASQLLGCTIDVSTALWWMRQEDATREQIYRNEDDDGVEWRTAHPRYVMTKLREFMVQDERWESGITEVWANPAAFDLPKIEYLIKRTGVDPVWTRRQPRCLRSVAEFVADKLDIIPDVPRVGNKHHALDDAITQAKRLQYAWQMMKAQ